MKNPGKQDMSSKDFCADPARATYSTRSACPAGRSTHSFCTVWKVDAGGEIDFETQGSYTIDWGDGCIEQIKSKAVSDKVNHVYVAAGEYNVKISLGITRFCGGWHTKKLIEIKQWGAAQWETMIWMFYGAENMVCTATDKPDTSKVEDMSFMFCSCSKFNSPIEHWDTKRVKYMSNMLCHARMFNRSLAKMDISSLKDTICMLEDTPAFNQDLRYFKTSSKVNTDELFGDYKSLADYNEKYGVQEQQQAVYSVLDGAGACRVL